MIDGAPVESRWFRPEPRRTLPAVLLEQIVDTTFTHRKVVEVQPFADGLRNANFRIKLDSIPAFVVLRIYEHDPSLCRKEVDLLNLIQNSVQTPQVIHAEPDGLNEIPPFALFRYVEGISFRELKHSEETASVSQAAYEAGQTLAWIGRTTFPKSGWLGPGPAVGAPLLEGANSGPRFVDLCLASANLQRRVGAELRDQTQALVWSYESQFASLDNETCLVHGDFGMRNLLVQQVSKKWTVAAVLDWEFAISGSPLTDVGHFLRYERSSRPIVEPHFSKGYSHAGGRLPDGWRRLARVIDLIALCESLTRDLLPDHIVAELVELVSATVEDRDPQFN
ncbi:MAG TPA: aminoglycoside phosphotransferase family protein [Candidatus Cybelea sp.]|nr:aminoglycoside phosphotransferase family protein [Candidatus Cybelea sp.]